MSNQTKDLQHWRHCLAGCSELFALRFIITKLLPIGAIDEKGACWLIKAMWFNHE
jgi:hypothetical protein